MAFLLAKASQAGSVETGAASGVENLLVTSFTSGAGGGESEISTGCVLKEKEKGMSQSHTLLYHTMGFRKENSVTLDIFVENQRKQAL